MKISSAEEELIATFCRDHIDKIMETLCENYRKRGAIQVMCIPKPGGGWETDGIGFIPLELVRRNAYVTRSSDAVTIMSLVEMYNLAHEVILIFLDCHTRQLIRTVKAHIDFEKITLRL